MLYSSYIASQKINYLIYPNLIVFLLNFILPNFIQFNFTLNSSFCIMFLNPAREVIMSELFITLFAKV